MSKATKRRMSALALAGVALVLTACSPDDGETARSRASASSTPSEEPATLQETCPEIEAELPKGIVPRPSAWSEYAAELEELRAEGDTETQNALSASQLIAASNDLAADPQGIPFLDARQAMRDGLDLMAKRCRAVGSSALQ